jgi:hypothetical protein
MSATDDSQRENQNSRKPYSPPKVSQIELRPEEAVLAGCKTSVDIGPFTNKCIKGANSCLTNAS